MKTNQNVQKVETDTPWVDYLTNMIGRQHCCSKGSATPCSPPGCFLSFPQKGLVWQTCPWRVPSQSNLPRKLIQKPHSYHEIPNTHHQHTTFRRLPILREEPQTQFQVHGEWQMAPPQTRFLFTPPKKASTPQGSQLHRRTTTKNC